MDQLTDHLPEMASEQGGPVDGPLRTGGSATVRTGSALYERTGTSHTPRKLTVDPYNCEQCGRRICAALISHQPCAACQAERTNP